MSSHSDRSGHSHCGCDHHESSAETISLIVSGVLVAVGLIAHGLDLVSENIFIAINLAAMVSGGWFLLPKAGRAIQQMRPDINLLVVIAAIGASIIGEWAEAATVMFLFGVAEWLEGWADRRAERATKALLEIAPKTARVQREGKFIEVPVADVNIDETIAVKSAMNIPLDGEVVSGESTVNQAPITGESVPVNKSGGDMVFAGTINGEGSLEIRVTKTSGDSTLAQIIRLVEEAQEQRAPTQRFVDTFARYYTPLVTALALFVFVVPPLAFNGGWSDWLYRACTLLIIACPCALVISTPVSIVAGLTALAKRGVLVKGGSHLESVAQLTALALDKTGTITEGKPQVKTIEAFGEYSGHDVLRIAAAIDDHSSHPLAKAIVAHTQDQNIDYPRAENYQSHHGRGASGTIDGHEYFVGNHRYTHELGVCSEDIEQRLATCEVKGQSAVVVGHRPHGNCEGEIIGIIATGDTVRPHATEAIRSLHCSGIKSIIMLSGDNQRTVDAIAKEVGLDQARGDLLPDDKVSAIKALRSEHRVVGMVGDGVNDAPAMAIATVGFAMGAAGTDAAIETADIALMEDELGKIAETVQLGQRTMGIIRFNICFALGLKALFLVLALTGHTSLWLAIMADTGATLLVVANSLRLLRARRSSSLPSSAST